MGAIAVLSGERRHPLNAWRRTAVLTTFSATLFVSAALLFSLQPMFAKMVLPVLGGTPAVWAVSTCFFQVVLLFGYCYAHLLNRYVPSRLAALVHGTVLTLAYFALPIALPAGAADPPPGGGYVWLIGVLISGVGVPFFAVSASAPLLQAWFSRSGDPQSADPYFLYGASNLGSLLALLSYPFVIERLFGLWSQSEVWTLGFVVLAFMVAICGAVTARNEPTPLNVDRGDLARAATSPVTARQRLHWSLCAFIPSGLLVASTSYVSTDIASAPFLWVMPLALFLATFIVVFRDREILPHDMLVDRLPLVAAALVMITSCSSAFPLPIALGVSLAAFLMTALVCHRALYLARPAGEHLTEFYLWMSFGGALGGIFSAIIAPQIFTTIFEFPLLAISGLLVSPLVIKDALTRGDWIRVAKVGSAGLALVLLVNVAVGAGWIEGSSTLRLVFLVGLLSILFAAQARPRLQIAVVASMLLVAPLIPEGTAVHYATRSFFGSLRVMEAEGGAVHFFLHGTTNHGTQRFRDAAGVPVAHPVPAQYYHPDGPLARGVDLARQVGGKAPGDFRAGIVGLGIGAMACYAKPSETWRFFEIDPAVVRLALDSSQFTYLATCQPAADIVVGDARLTLAKEASKTFDFLLMDAFSSDAVPTHLLTFESIGMYVEKLTDSGVLTMHVSNRHLDLAPVVLAAVQKLPGVHAVVVRDGSPPGGYDKSPSNAVLITKSEAALAHIQAWPDAQTPEQTDVPAWTDDYSDIVSALWRQYLH